MSDASGEAPVEDNQGRQEEPEHEFLIPGPTPESNEGCLSWGLAWVIVSIVILIMIGAVTVGCYFLSSALGLI